MCRIYKGRPFKNCKENILVLTETFTKFSQVFITLTMAKIIVVKWLYMYGIATHIHNDHRWCFNNEIMKQLYAMYGIEQLTTIPYNLHGNATCRGFNHTLMDLLKSLLKEEKSNWPLHLPSLIFTYNARTHSMTGYQPHVKVQDVLL